MVAPRPCEADNLDDTLLGIVESFYERLQAQIENDEAAKLPPAKVRIGGDPESLKVWGPIRHSATFNETLNDSISKVAPQDRFTELLPEILDAIFKYFNEEDISNAAQVSRSWSATVRRHTVDDIAPISIS